MKIDINNTKCEIKITSKFKSQFKKIARQRKNFDELKYVITKLANLEKLDKKYQNHQLINDKMYKNCYECHIRPDWLLIYKYENDNLLLVLFATGSHSELFLK